MDTDDAPLLRATLAAACSIFSFRPKMEVQMIKSQLRAEQRMQSEGPFAAQ
jgi:hypothetical protein